MTGLSFIIEVVWVRELPIKPMLFSRAQNYATLARKKVIFGTFVFNPDRGFFSDSAFAHVAIKAQIASFHDRSEVVPRRGKKKESK